MKNKVIKFGFAIALYIVLSGQGFSQTESSNHTQVKMKGTEIRTLHSNIVDKDYELFISLPKSYQTSEKNYAVFVLLDPFRSFSIVKGYIDVLTTPLPLIEEQIIVGVGYGGQGDEELFNWIVGRTRDLSPEQDSLTENWMVNQIQKSIGVDLDFQTGGAPLFLEFLEQELFPFIESNYRIDEENSTLYGYSFGGLFALYTLFHKPWLFKNYLCGSPSLHFKNEITFKYESDYAQNHSDLNANVFISAGELEPITSANILRMEELLRSRNYMNLTLKTVIFDDEDHITCPLASISRGIKELLGYKKNQ